MWIFWVTLAAISLFFALLGVENALLWLVGGVVWLAVAAIDFYKRD